MRVAVSIDGVVSVPFSGVGLSFPIRESGHRLCTGCGHVLGRENQSTVRVGTPADYQGVPEMGTPTVARPDGGDGRTLVPTVSFRGSKPQGSVIRMVRCNPSRGQDGGTAVHADGIHIPGIGRSFDWTFDTGHRFQLHVWVRNSSLVHEGTAVQL